MILFFAAVPLSGSGSHVLDDYIAGIAEGDREALAGLYRETHTAVYGFALSLCANAQDAEDVLQDTYLQVSRAAAAYQSQGKPMAWMLTIARNLALQRMRERERTVTMTPEDWQTQFADRVASPATTGWYWRRWSPPSARRSGRSSCSTLLPG